MNLQRRRAGKTKQKNYRTWALAFASFILLCSLLLSLLSCGSVYERILGFLGYDVYDYAGESALSSHEPESETAQDLAELLQPLLLDKLKLEDFSDSRQVSELYRDAILNYLLNAYYTKYTGNLDLLKAAEEEYPHYNITTLIPKNDFEKTVYQYFGGEKSVKNVSGVIFTYLDKVNAYTIVGQPQKSNIEIEVTELSETENTFRMRFFTILDGDMSPVYMALIIKREDGTRYIKSLAKIADERVTAPSA